MPERQGSEIDADRSVNWALLIGFLVMVISVATFAVVVRACGASWSGITFGGDQMTWKDSITVVVGFVAFHAGYVTTIYVAKRRRRHSVDRDASES